MKIALEQVTHVQMGNVCVEEMIYVLLTMFTYSRDVYLGNALLHNHCS